MLATLEQLFILHVMKVPCPHCGFPLSALKDGICPGCGFEYDDGAVRQMGLRSIRLLKSLHADTYRTLGVVLVCGSIGLKVGNSVALSALLFLIQLAVLMLLFLQTIAYG